MMNKDRIANTFLLSKKTPVVSNRTGFKNKYSNGYNRFLPQNQCPDLNPNQTKKEMHPNC